MRSTGRARIAGLLLLAWLGVARLVRADEPISAREPRLMSETAEITSVVDAFDDGDPFDLNLLIGFSQSWKHANIRRETQIAQPGLATGGFIPATENIASYSSTVSTLLVGADVGLYRDLALVLRLPVILNWSQSLGDLNGSQAVDGQLLQDPTGAPIFTVPFSSPRRSGVDYLAAGLDWGIYNQRRDPAKVTWVVGVEGRFALGAPLHACNANPPPGVATCPDPVTGQNRDAGISRGVESIIVKSVWSRRFGYVEPYTGFWAQADFPNGNSDLGKWNPTQNIERSPPLLGSVALGLEVVPYERREQFQRMSADFHFKGTYHSPGRDYSELFDALGSSQAPSLRTPNPAGYVANPGAGPPSVADPASERVYFTGVTEEQAYGSFTVSAAATWQAGEYVKFTLGSAVTYAQPHLVTAADSCNSSITDPAQAGPCRGTLNGQSVVAGAPNPDHRDVIDLPGRRFSVDDTTVVDLYVMGIVMF
ncbi:MAG: hypothetical protein WBY94_18800 [Polyangiaceae bacterium]